MPRIAQAVKIDSVQRTEGHQIVIQALLPLIWQADQPIIVFDQVRQRLFQCGKIVELHDELVEKYVERYLNAFHQKRKELGLHKMMCQRWYADAESQLGLDDWSEALSRRANVNRHLLM